MSSSIQIFSTNICKTCNGRIRPCGDVKTKTEYAGHDQKMKEVCGKMLLLKMMEGMA